MERQRKNVFLPAAFVAYSTTILLGALVVIINATMVPLADTYQIDLPRTGLLISFIGIGRIGIQVFGGSFVDKFGRKPICLIGLFIMMSFFLTLPFSASFILSAVLCVMAGIGYGLVNTSSMALIYDYFAPTNRNAVAQSYVQVLFASGGVLIPLAANRLLEGGLFWGNLFWGCAALSAAMMVLLLIFRCPPVFRRTAAESGFTVQPKLRYDGMLLSLVVFFAYSMGFVCTTWLSLLARERIGLGEHQSVLLLAMYNIGGISGALLFAQILRKHHGLQFMILNPAVAMAGFLLCILSRSNLLFFLGAFIGGAMIAIVFNLSIGVGGEMFGAKSGIITGMIATASSASSLLTPALSGMIVRSCGARPAFILVYVFGVLAVGTGLLLRRHYRLLKKNSASSGGSNV